MVPQHHCGFYCASTPVAAKIEGRLAQHKLRDWHITMVDDAIPDASPRFGSEEATMWVVRLFANDQPKRDAIAYL